MSGKEKTLASWLIVGGIFALLAGLYINLTIAHYQAGSSWTGDCVIAVIWGVAALVSGWRIYSVSFKNYQEIKSKKQSKNKKNKKQRG